MRAGTRESRYLLLPGVASKGQAHACWQAGGGVQFRNPSRRCEVAKGVKQQEMAEAVVDSAKYLQVGFRS